MATFTYTAARNLKSGHTSGSEYTITIDLVQADGDQPQAITKAHKALDGTPVTVLHRIERYLRIRTDWIQVSGGTPDVDDFTEFFDSVAGGEAFVFNDGSDRSAMMEGDPARTRNGVHFNYSFRIRLL